MAFLLGFSSVSQSEPKSDSYEVTAYAGYDVMCCLLDEPKLGTSEGLTIHGFVKAEAPFVFLTGDEHGNHLRVSGTVREIDKQDFFLEKGELEGFGMAAEGGMCNSKETREMQKALESVLGPEGHRNAIDSVEAVSGGWWISIGPGYRLSIKRLKNSPQLQIHHTANNFILTWATNAAGATVQSTTNLFSPVWTTNLAAPVVVSGQFTVTNPISGRQQFYRLSQP